MYVAATVPVSKAKAKLGRRFGIRGTRTFVSLARPGVRAVWFLFPHPPAG